MNQLRCSPRNIGRPILGDTLIQMLKTKALQSRVSKDRSIQNHKPYDPVLRDLGAGQLNMVASRSSSLLQPTLYASEYTSSYSDQAYCILTELLFKRRCKWGETGTTSYSKKSSRLLQGQVAASLASTSARVRLRCLDLKL